MSRPVLVDLFVEDRAHEEFIGPLVGRMAAEQGLEIRSRVRSARGGHGRAIDEFKLYQTLIEKGGAAGPMPDLVIVGIDGNCATFARKEDEIRRATSQRFANRLVVACPDPHVERWYLADPDSFQIAVGARPSLGRRKCARDHYKGVLREAVRQAGHPATLGGIEFAQEIVAGVNWYRAGRNDRSLKAFLDALRAGFVRLKPPAARPFARPERR